MGSASACIPLFPCLSSLPLAFLAVSFSLSPSLSPLLSHSLSHTHMGTMPESGSDNRATCRQGQEAGTGCLARALARAPTGRKWGKRKGRVKVWKSLWVEGSWRWWDKTSKWGHEGWPSEKHYWVLDRLMMEKKQITGQTMVIEGRNAGEIVRRKELWHPLMGPSVF